MFLLDLNDLKSHSALSLLESYDGINPYLKRLKNDLLTNKSLSLTDTQAKYIIDNHQKDPIFINRVIGITKYLGEELKKQEDLICGPINIQSNKQH